jgi:ABC-type polar amino acid transport system ATPase subunit
VKNNAQPPERKTVLSARGLSKRLGGNLVLDDVSLEVASHESVAIIGPSGAGKSTLLRSLNLLERPDAGEVWVEGDCLTSARKRDIPRLRARIGMVFQHFNLFPHLTALQNVMLGPHRALGRDAAETEADATQLLARVGLGEKLDAYPRHLSGGQQQRVAIARALALRPTVVLFDEPTAALDAELVHEVLAVIRDLALNGTTMLIVSHEVGFVKEAADRVLFMDQGKIIEEEAPAALFSSPVEERTRRFVEKIL